MKIPPEFLNYIKVMLIQLVPKAQQFDSYSKSNYSHTLKTKTAFEFTSKAVLYLLCLLYTSPSPRD